MAALAAVAAQLYGHGVRGMYHLYVDEDLERDGSPDRFWVIDRQRRREVMRPPEGQCRLVDVAFFQIRPSEQGAQLVLCGRMQDYILDYLADNPELVAVLEPDTRGQVLGYVFEVQVINYLRSQGYDARQSETVGGHEVDVYAERGDEILICECQFRENPARSIGAYKVHQIIKRLEYLRERFPGRRITAWVVSNAGTLEDDVNQWAKIQAFGGDLQVRQAPLRSVVLRKIREQKWIALLREDWLAGEIEPVQRPDP
jgi:Holliday junction resolvase